MVKFSVSFSGSVSTASISSSSAPPELSPNLTPPLKRSLSNSSTGATSAKSFSSKRSSSTSLDKFIIKTSASQKENLDEEVARMIFATNSPFRLVQHPQFLKMVQTLRPGYIPPSRKDIADKYLDLVYEKEYKKCADDLNNETVCLSLDGWSNIHNEPIICVTLTTSTGQIYLVDTIDTSGKPHTADYLLQLVQNSIKKAEQDFGCRIGSVVTDNAANVTKMRKLLEESSETEHTVLTYGCAAHLLNLLAHDLEIDNVKQHVVHVVKYFRNNHYAAARYRQEGGQCLVMPQDTRWNTMSDCLKAYITNWPILMKICEINREAIDTEVRNKVSNLGLKHSAEELLDRLQPIAKALDEVQSDKCTIAQAVDVWKKLLGHFTNNKQAEKLVKKRYEQFITKAHLLANMLHPALQGKMLSAEEVNITMEYANEKYATLVPVIMKFQAKSPPFQAFKFTESVTKTLTAIEWWDSHTAMLDSDILLSVRQLLTAVASSSGVERVFSSYGLVHTKLRNRLGTEKAAKLVFLFKTMNSNVNND